MLHRACQIAAICFGFTSAFGQTTPAAPDGAPATPAAYTVQAGTHIPLGLINSVSTKHSAAGDRIYLETVFPIVIDSHIVIPPGSYVTGTVTEIKRPGRVKGRAELYVRFDSLTLPNGVTRDFRSRLGSIDARGDEHLDKKEGMVQGDSNKIGDARTTRRDCGERRFDRRYSGLGGGACGHGGRYRRRCGSRCGTCRSITESRSRRDARQGKHDRNGARPAADLRRERSQFRFDRGLGSFFGRSRTGSHEQERRGAR